MTPQELVSAACPKIGQLGAVFYFHPKTVATGKEHNLDGFRFYFLGRGGVLGDVEPAVVQSAFGYFHRDLVAKIWNSAKERMAPRAAAALYMECCRRIGRDAFGDIAGLDRFCASAEAVVAAIDPAGLALYAGTAAEPLPDDLPGRAMQLVAVLREYRGSAHLLAVIASGVAADVAHAIRRPDDTATFGYAEAPASTDADRAALAAADALTDSLCAGPYAAVAEGDRAHFVATLEAMEKALLG
jgi:hypothetical protein